MLKTRVLNVLKSGRQFTPAQLAGLVGSSQDSIRPRISELRSEGHAIYTNTTKNGKIETRPPRVEFDMIDKEKIFNVFVPLFNSEDLDFLPHEYHEPTIDEILDKITEQGIESITKQERQILENYGKRENRRSENE